MQYLVEKDSFTKISETEGTLQNASKITTIEVSDLQTQNNGLLLPPLGKIILGGDSIYVRCVDGAGAEVRVVPFEAAGEGGGGGKRPDFSLDQTGTNVVENFLFSALEYPNATNPNLDGKTVLVLAVKDANGKSDLVKYIFVDLAKVIDVYAAGDSSILVTDGDISVRLSATQGNILSLADDGLFANLAVSGGVSGNFAVIGTSGLITDGDFSVADITASIDAKIDKVPAAAQSNIAVFGASGVLVDGGFSFADVDPSGKIDRVTTAVDGNFAVWSASGMLQDSGLSAAGFVSVNDFVPFTGATSSTGGAAGLVPEPSRGDDKKFLRGDGIWSNELALPTVASSLDGCLWHDANGGVIKYVSGDKTYTLLTENKAVEISGLPLLGTALNDWTWEQISAVSRAGLGDSFFDIGDCKEITLNGNVGDCLTLSNEKLCVFILHFNYALNGTADNNIIWGGFKTALTDGIDVALVDSKYASTSVDGTICFNMNHTGQDSDATANGYRGTNYGGWKGCDLRYDILGATSTAPSEYNQLKSTANVGYNATAATLTSPKSDTLLAALPSDFRNALRLWSRWIDAKGNGSNTEAGIEETIDAVTLLAYFEVHGEQNNANQYEQNHQTQMAYYAAGNSYIKYRHSSTSNTAVWWRASASKYNNSNHTFYFNSGSTYSAWGVYAVAPAFMT